MKVIGFNKKEAIFKNNYLKMLDLDLVMANLIVNKDWDRNICILKSKV